MSSKNTQSKLVRGERESPTSITRALLVAFALITIAEEGAAEQSESMLAPSIGTDGSRIPAQCLVGIEFPGGRNPDPQYRSRTSDRRLIGHLPDHIPNPSPGASVPVGSSRYLLPPLNSRLRDLRLCDVENRGKERALRDNRRFGGASSNDRSVDHIVSPAALVLQSSDHNDMEILLGFMAVGLVGVGFYAWDVCEYEEDREEKFLCWGADSQAESAAYSAAFGMTVGCLFGAVVNGWLDPRDIADAIADPRDLASHVALVVTPSGHPRAVSVGLRIPL